MSFGVWPRRRELTFASGEGECAAWFSAPDAPGPHPCVVMGHGFSLTRHDGLPEYAEVFAAAGLAVLAFDYRNFGDSPGEPRQRFRRSWQVADFHSAVVCARSQPGIDPRRVALWGFSFGGAHAIEAAIADPTVAATLVLCPFVDGFRRVLATRPGLAAWIIPRALADQSGRHTLVPVTAQPGGHGTMSLPGEADGFAATVPAGSPWRNEISPAIFLSVATYRPVTRARRITQPLWVGLGNTDVTTAEASVERLAVGAQQGELHRYDTDHFGVFADWLRSQIAHDQVKFLRRINVGPPESPARIPTNPPGPG